MSPVSFRESVRRAAKPHRCSMCNASIRVGDLHHVSTNCYDGRVYDWRTCQPCRRDRVTGMVYDWTGHPDEGVDLDDAIEWAPEAILYAKGHERRSARDWLARYCGGDGE